MLDCPEDVYCFQFSPSDPNIIVGGCINGQVLILCLRIKLDISVFSYSIKNKGEEMHSTSIITHSVTRQISESQKFSDPVLKLCLVIPQLSRYCMMPLHSTDK